MTTGMTTEELPSVVTTWARLVSQAWRWWTKK
jgi:hypothetical protein